MPPASAAVASSLSLPEFPRWTLWLLLIFFVASLITISVLLARSSRSSRRNAEYGEDDPWPGWRHHDGHDAADALTDPNLLPAIEPDGQMTLAMQLDEPLVQPRPRRPEPELPKRRLEPQHVADITSFDMPPIMGEVVSRRNWAQTMTVPAPEIVARPLGLADEWIASWERGEQRDPDEWTRRILESASR